MITTISIYHIEHYKYKHIKLITMATIKLHNVLVTTKPLAPDVPQPGVDTGGGSGVESPPGLHTSEPSMKVDRPST